MLSRNIPRATRAIVRSASTTSTQSFSPIHLSSRQLWTKSPLPQISQSFIKSPNRIRHYSSEAPKETEPAKDPESKTPTNPELDTLRKDLETKTKEAIDFKDKYLRSLADYRNLQDRTKREASAAHSFALQKLIRDLIPSLDNLDAALSSIPSTKLSPPSSDTSIEAVHSDLKNLHEGMAMTSSVLIGALGKHGVTVFHPMGESFDPNRHEAVFHAPKEGGKDGEVMMVQSKGVELNGRVLRAAQVGVVNNPS